MGRTLLSLAGGLTGLIVAGVAYIAVIRDIAEQMDGSKRVEGLAARSHDPLFVSLGLWGLLVVPIAGMLLGIRISHCFNRRKPSL
jgi:hypothetical protein